MKNYVSTGDHLTVRAPSDIKSGDFVVMNEVFGFTQADAKEGEIFALVRRGEFSVDLPGQPSAFVPVFVTPGGQLTTSASGNRRIGMTGASGDTVILQESFDESSSGGGENAGDGGDPGEGGISPFLSLSHNPADPVSGEELTVYVNWVDNATGLPLSFPGFDDMQFIMNGTDVSGSDLNVEWPFIRYTPTEPGDLNVSVTLTSDETGETRTATRLISVS